jgi:hypothetical protein
MRNHSRSRPWPGALLPGPSMAPSESQHSKQVWASNSQRLKCRGSFPKWWRSRMGINHLRRIPDAPKSQIEMSGLFSERKLTEKSPGTLALPERLTGHSGREGQVGRTGCRRCCTSFFCGFQVIFNVVELDDVRHLFQRNPRRSAA